MKVFVIALLTVLFGSGFCADDLPKKAGAPYQQLELTGKKDREVVAILESFKITDLEIENVTPREALEYLRKKVVGESREGVINLVVRGTRNLEKKISIKKETSNYAKAVEAICKQAGWRWQITHDGPGGTPVLVIKTGNKS